MICFSILPPPPLPNLIAPNDQIALPPHFSPVEPPHLYLLHHACVFLVVVVFELLVGGHLRPRRLFFIFLSCSVCCPERRDTHPHRFHPGHVYSPMILQRLTPTFGWLLCPPIKRQPSKAKGLPISLLKFVHRLTTKQR